MTPRSTDSSSTIILAPQRYSWQSFTSIFVVSSIAVFVATVISFLPNSPSVFHIVMWAISTFVATRIRSIYAQAIILFWHAWYVIGIISYAAATTARVGVFSFNQADPNVFSLIYVVFLVAITLGASVFDLLFIGRKDQPVYIRLRPTDGLIVLTLMLFSFIYLVTTFFGAGGIPILSGANVSASMYETNYSPLRSFSFACVLAALAIFLHSPLKRKAFIQYVLIAIVIFCAVVDGRRVFGLFAMMAIALAAYGDDQSIKSRLRIGALAVVAVTFYIGLSLLRSANSFDQQWLVMVAAVGVEFRDSIFLISTYSPEAIRAGGYDWSLSTFAALTNGAVLEVMGINKAEAISHDSARTLMRYMNVMLGIRVGIITEWWFAFGWWGVAPMAALGGALVALSHWASRTSSFLSRVVLVSLLAVMAMAIMGQSTVTFGLLPTTLYITLALMIVKAVGARLGSWTAPARSFAPRLPR